MTSHDRVGTLTYNAADQLTSRTDGTNTITYTYYDNGNQTAAGSRSYSFNLANQPRPAIQSAARSKALRGHNVVDSTCDDVYAVRPPEPAWQQVLR
jgi:YD repeat-containing protein